MKKSKNQKNQKAMKKNCLGNPSLIRYSLDAHELLSSSEMNEIKAGRETKGGNQSPSTETSMSYSSCAVCVGCIIAAVL